MMSKTNSAAVTTGQEKQMPENALCEQVMNRFLELDKGERLPFSVTLHLLRCKQCRTQVRLLSIAERVASRRQPARKPGVYKPVTLTNWVIGGTLMVLCMLAFALTADAYGDEMLWTAFALVFAFCVTGYCALFVGCNMDFFVKKIQRLL